MVVSTAPLPVALAAEGEEVSLEMPALALALGACDHFASSPVTYSR